MSRLDRAQNINQRKITHVILSLLFFAGLIPLTACDSAQNKIQASRVGSEVTTITKITPIAAKPDEVVRLTGTNFYEEKNLNISLAISNGDVVSVPVSVTDSRNASFLMPAGAGLGVKEVTLTQGLARIEVTKFNLIADQGNNQLPIVVGDGSTVCSDQQYIDRNGDIQTGAKDCSAASPIAPCTENGAVGCVTTETFKAADLTNLSPSNIKSGVNIAGITGNITPSPDTCSSNGQQSCVAAGSYFAGTVCTTDGSNCFLPTYSIPGLQTKKAIDFATIDSSKMLDSLTISGVTGVIASEKSWDLTAPFPGSAYYTGISNTPASSQYTGTLFGVSGSAILKPNDCSADGGIGCVTTAEFAAAATTGADAKIIHGQSVGGVSGKVHLPSSGDVRLNVTFGLNNTVTGSLDPGAGIPPSCASENETNCVANSNFPAVDFARIADNPDKMLADFSVVGVSGSISTCAADGSNCFLPAYSVMSQPLKAISYNSIDATKMLDSLTISGVMGTIIPRGPWDVTTTFPGAGYYSAIDQAPASGTYTGTLFGIAGTAVLKPADCSTNGATGCVTTSTYKSADLTNLSAGNIKSTVTIAGVTGNYPSLTSPLTGADTTDDLSNVLATREGQLRSATNFEFFMSDGTRVLASGDSDISSANIASGFNIFGQAGGATLSPDNCSSNGQQSCVASGSYYAGTNCTANGSGCYLPTYALATQPLKAIDYDNINTNAARIRSGTTLGGVNGTLADCSTNGSNGCVATSTYLAGQNQGSWNMTTSFPGAGYYSGSTNTPTAGNIKSGVSIAGVTGQYPNSTFKLTGSSGTDLTAATFNAQIKSSSTFQYFGADGARYTGTGDSDIIDSNIKSTIDIFGTTGNVVQPVAPDPWNVRVGTTINGVVGKLKVNCRNRSNPSIFDVSEGNTVTVTTGTPGTLTATTMLSSISISNGIAVRLAYTNAPGGLNNSTTYYVRDASLMAFKLATTVGGTAIAITSIGTDVMVYRWQESPQSIDIWDTIDDLNNDISGLPPSVVSDWGNSTDCGGVQTAAGDDNVWQDVTTTNGVTASTCAATSTNCTMKDKITGLWWSKLQVAESWHMAWRRCGGIFNVSVFGSNSSVGYNGKTGWRLPTQKELLEAYTHGIRSAARTNWILESNMTKDNNNDLWSGSVNSLSGGSAWRVALGNGEVASRSVENSQPFFCVR